MIHSSFYLYSNKIDVFTNLLDPWTNERYRKVYNRNLKIYRGTNNRITTQLRNCDQKPISIPDNYTMVFNLVVKETQKFILKKDFVSVEDGSSTIELGRAYVELTEDEMRSLEPGFYQYSVILEERNLISVDQYEVTNSKVLYVDSQFGAYAILEIFGDIQGEPIPSNEIKEFTYVNPFTVGEQNDKFYFSSIIDADPYRSTPHSTHTFQIYFTNYSGLITIEASLDDQGATPKNWFPVTPDNQDTHSFRFNDQNDSIYKNVTGKYNWFRIKHLPFFGLEAAFNVVNTNFGTYTVTVSSAGKNYKLGDTIFIKGVDIGGVDGVNDLTIIVTNIDINGGITAISASGLSNSSNKTFVGIKAPSGKLDKILYR